MIIVCFGLILILLILYFKFKSSFGGVYNGDKWNDYRIGDVYKYMSDKNENMYDPKLPWNVLYHKTKYPNSIASEYMSKNNMKGKNKELMDKIIKSRTKNDGTQPDTLFLHIRVGDVLCDKSEWLDEINGKVYYSKMGDTVWWNDILKYIRSNNISKVVIISGSHTNKCIQESINYINDRGEFLKNNIPSLTINYQLGQSPDDDIILCYHVKHFITTGGGYGNMIKELKK